MIYEFNIESFRERIFRDEFWLWQQEINNVLKALTFNPPKPELWFVKRLIKSDINDSVELKVGISWLCGEGGSQNWNDTRDVCDPSTSKLLEPGYVNNVAVFTASAIRRLDTTTWNNVTSSEWINIEIKDPTLNNNMTLAYIYNNITLPVPTISPTRVPTLTPTLTPTFSPTKKQAFCNFNNNYNIITCEFDGPIDDTYSNLINTYSKSYEYCKRFIDDDIQYKIGIPNNNNNININNNILSSCQINNGIRYQNRILINTIDIYLSKDSTIMVNDKLPICLTLENDFGNCNDLAKRPNTIILPYTGQISQQSILYSPKSSYVIYIKI